MIDASFFLFDWLGDFFQLLLGWVFDFANTIKETYGVNPWVYLFIWFILAAPPWYLGIYWIFKGLAETDPIRFRRGILLNRFGYALAPAYVLIWGENMGWTKILWIVLPLIISWWFYRYRLMNKNWVEKNQGWMSAIGRFFEVILVLPFKPRLWPKYARVVGRAIRQTQILLRLLTWSRIKVRLVQPGTDEHERVCEVERAVFEAETYPYDYRKYDTQSYLIGAFDGKKAVGAVRLIGGTPGLLPPILTECKMFNAHQYTQKALEGIFEEIGTVAVLPKYRSQMVSVDLYRAATDCARKRGVIEWGIIEEPERVRQMNDTLHFKFWLEGELGYHGWDCAPFVLNIEDTIQNIKQRDKILHRIIMRGRVQMPPKASGAAVAA